MISMNILFTIYSRYFIDSTIFSCRFNTRNNFWRNWGYWNGIFLFVICCGFGRKTIGCIECCLYLFGEVNYTIFHFHLLLRMPGFHSRICSRSLFRWLLFGEMVMDGVLTMSKKLLCMRMWDWDFTYWIFVMIDRHCFWIVCWILFISSSIVISKACLLEEDQGRQYLQNAWKKEEGGGAWWIWGERAPFFE